MADPFYKDFTSPRTTMVDEISLRATLIGMDPTAGIAVSPDGKSFHVKKSTAWTPQQITAVQNAINNASALTPQLIAQREIAAWPISMKAFAYALVDRLNVMGAAMTPPLAPITEADVMNAILAKAGSL